MVLGVIQEVEKAGFLSHVTEGMWLMFLLGVLCLFAYAWKTKKETGVNKYMKLNAPNILFHLIASFMVFLTLEETGEYLIKKFFPNFNATETYHYTLSGLTGLFGSVFVAWILELGKKLFGSKRNEVETNSTVDPTKPDGPKT